jgi:hypothetical protein
MAALTMYTLSTRLSVMSLKTHAMHSRLVYQLCVQTLTPAILLLVPALTTILSALGLGFSLGDRQHAYYAVWLSLWTPVNTLVLIYFVTPYRRFTSQLLLSVVGAMFLCRSCQVS